MVMVMVRVRANDLIWSCIWC